MAAKKKYYEGKGTRKTSTARVRIYEGKDSSVINEMPFEEYYPDEFRRERLLKPLTVTGFKDKVYFSAQVSGGGRLTGQLDSIVLGLARALIEMDPSLKETLAKQGLTTRDPREKERKKYFHIKARKKPQFSKR
jgi:small subunit ribosomal protein S9